jgi:hypothetical protein
MIEYYENLVIKTMLEMEKSEDMIAGLLKDQAGEDDTENEEEYSMEDLIQFVEEVKNRTLH